MSNNTQTHHENSWTVKILDRTAQFTCVLMAITFCLVILYRAYNGHSNGFEVGFTHIFAGILGYVARQQLGKN